MATALVDLYGGDDFERFDRIILPESYRPSDKDEFMCAKHRAYFLRKLKAWKEAIIEESCASQTSPTAPHPRRTGRLSSALATGSASSSPRSIARSAVSTRANMAIAK
jgi:hypothetical protein